jgi:hypothetical protein
VRRRQNQTPGRGRATACDGHAELVEGRQIELVAAKAARLKRAVVARIAKSRVHLFGVVGCSSVSACCAKSCGRIASARASSPCAVKFVSGARTPRSTAAFLPRMELGGSYLSLKIIGSAGNRQGFDNHDFGGAWSTRRISRSTSTLRCSWLKIENHCRSRSLCALNAACICFSPAVVRATRT